MAKIQKYNPVVLLGYTLYAFIAYSYIIGNLSMASNLISVCYIWIVYIAYKVFANHNISHNEKVTVVLLFALCFINVFIDSLINSGPFTFSYYKKLIMFISSILWIVYCKYSYIQKWDYYYISLIMAILSVVAYMNISSGFAIQDGGIFLQYGFTNSNQAGMMLSACVIFLMSGLFYGGYKRYIKIVILLLTIAITYVTYLTGCRSALLAIAFPPFLMVFEMVTKKVYWNKFLLFLYSWLPLIFLLAYFTFAASLSYDMNFGFETGKTNESRLEVWEASLNSVSGHEIFGNYYQASHGTGEFQSLNTHLDVLNSYGFIPLIIFILIIYRVLTAKDIRLYSNFQRYGLYSFMACFIIGCFEAGLVAGSAGLFVAAFGMVLLSNYHDIETT